MFRHVLAKYIDGDEEVENLTVLEAKEALEQGRGAVEAVTEECMGDGEVVLRCMGMVFEDEIAVEMGVVIVTTERLFHFDVNGNCVMSTALPDSHAADEPFVDFYVYHDIGFVALSTESMSQPLVFLPHMYSLDAITPPATSPIDKTCQEIRSVFERPSRVKYLYFSMENTTSTFTEWETLHRSMLLHENVHRLTQTTTYYDEYEDGSATPIETPVDTPRPHPPIEETPERDCTPSPQPVQPSNRTIIIGRKGVQKERWTKRVTDVVDHNADKNLRWKAPAQWVHREGYEECTVALTQLEVIIFNEDSVEVWKERITELTSIAINTDDLIKLTLRNGAEYLLLLSMKGGLAKEFCDRIQKTRPMKVLQLTKESIQRDVPHAVMMVEEVNKIVAVERERTVRFHETAEVRGEDEMSPVTYEMLKARQSSFASDGALTVSDGDDDTPTPEPPQDFDADFSFNSTFNEALSPSSNSSGPITIHRSKGLYSVETSLASFGETHPLKQSRAARRLPPLVKPSPQSFSLFVPQPVHPHDPVNDILTREVNDFHKNRPVETQLSDALAEIKNDVREEVENSSMSLEIYNEDEQRLLSEIETAIRSVVEVQGGEVGSQTEVDNASVGETKSTQTIDAVIVELKEETGRAKIEAEYYQSCLGFVAVPRPMMVMESLSTSPVHLAMHSSPVSPIFPAPVCYDMATMTTPVTTTTSLTQTPPIETTSKSIETEPLPEPDLDDSLITELRLIPLDDTALFKNALEGTADAVACYLDGLQQIFGSLAGVNTGYISPNNVTIPEVGSRGSAPSIVSNDSMSERERLRELVLQRERLEEELEYERKSRSASPSPPVAVRETLPPSPPREKSEKKQLMERTLRDMRARRREIETRLVENNIHIDLPASGFAKGFEGQVPLHSSP
eukprot:TRINITY_DN19114_c0_g2_i1.p1 TRINITY_DN19114_c0_g2~~TRINITY_DN19114_c0_g2_i1.p1  ORF type:complete len:908 (+),score=156.38 TRINITY_DN19114_c0_g2_i1:36-2759(+)